MRAFALPDRLDTFGPDDQRRALARRAPGPLAVYVHIPFCESVCYYCACNKVVTKHHDRASPYLDALTTEIGLYRAALGGPQPVTQLHLGGGTPTFLSDGELTRLMATLRQAPRRNSLGLTPTRLRNRKPSGCLFG